MLPHVPSARIQGSILVVITRQAYRDVSGSGLINGAGILRLLLGTGDKNGGVTQLGLMDYHPRPGLGDEYNLIGAQNITNNPKVHGTLQTQNGKSGFPTRPRGLTEDTSVVRRTLNASSVQTPNYTAKGPVC